MFALTDLRRLCFRNGLCVCVQNISNGYERILIKKNLKRAAWPNDNRSDFGGDPDIPSG